MNSPLVTVITGTVANPLLSRCLASVQAQTYPEVQHLVIVDGPQYHHKVWEAIDSLTISRHPIDPIYLPYNTGGDGWNAHRLISAGVYIAKGDVVMWLDDDNSYEPNHIEQCVELLQKGAPWSYSLRNIVDKNHQFICQDNCESLGMWPSMLSPEDKFVDVNCFCLPKHLALAITPVMHRKFRVPGQIEIDRAMMRVLGQIAPNYACTREYTVNYTVGNTERSVQANFFLQGNEVMRGRYGGKYPWQK